MLGKTHHQLGTLPSLPSRITLLSDKQDKHKKYINIMRKFQIWIKKP